MPCGDGHHGPFSRVCASRVTAVVSTVAKTMKPASRTKVDLIAHLQTGEDGKTKQPEGKVVRAAVAGGFGRTASCRRDRSDRASRIRTSSRAARYPTGANSPSA